MRDEHGQAAAVWIIVGALSVTSAWGLARGTERLLERQRARAAADAAALACVTSGHAGAQRLASANGALLVRADVVSEASGVTCTVTVRRGEIEATARATDTLP